jgi:hypothetical protein
MTLELTIRRNFTGIKLVMARCEGGKDVTVYGAAGVIALAFDGSEYCNYDLRKERHHLLNNSLSTSGKTSRASEAKRAIM